MNQKQLDTFIRETGDLLLRSRNSEGFWEGSLSSGALGVAVAITALHFYDATGNQKQIKGGLHWLEANVNGDGGFGDTPESMSNVSTSLLCYAAIYKCRTNAFDFVPQLPFELALLPRAFYRLLNLSVVSYAIPVLIAVGIVTFRFKSQKNPLMQVIRQASIKKSLRLLEKIRPESGGFLEAIPLTAFVCICLIEAGCRQLPAVANGISFLKKTWRKDGSWPIDIDLSTWVTSLSVKSFRSELNTFLDPKSQDQLTEHFLSIQNKAVHPFNGSPPGGWGWTHFSGSVPDCDDTPGAVLAMLALNKFRSQKVCNAVLNGCKWMMQLQNKDGGFPTFCRGWGKLPFDRSCADLTGHAVLAFIKTLEFYSSGQSHDIFPKISRSLSRALDFLEKNQREDGSWLPLWFGNQHAADHTNPVYGTARVLSYLNDALECKGLDNILRSRIKKMCRNAAVFLVSVQNPDGSWGGNPGVNGSIEETALAVTALCPDDYLNQVQNGLLWLEKKIQSEGFVASPIGLYFATLWYSEKLYPVTAMMECLVRLKETGFLIRVSDSIFNNV